MGATPTTYGNLRESIPWAASRTCTVPFAFLSLSRKVTVMSHMDREGEKTTVCLHQKFSLGPSFPCLQKISLYQTRAVSITPSLCERKWKCMITQSRCAEILPGRFEQRRECVSCHQNRPNGTETAGHNRRQGRWVTDWCSRNLRLELSVNRYMHYWWYTWCHVFLIFVVVDGLQWSPTAWLARHDWQHEQNKQQVVWSAKSRVSVWSVRSVLILRRSVVCLHVCLTFWWNTWE